MKSSSSFNNIPEWNGEPDNLPQEIELFSYRGGQYFWRSIACPECGKDHKVVFSKTTRTVDAGMSIRVAGRDQEIYMIKVLVALGHMDEIATYASTNGFMQLLAFLQRLYARTRGAFVPTDSAFLQEHDLTENDVKQADEEFLEAITPRIIVINDVDVTLPSNN
jgi:hypothetical protein